MNWRKQGAVPGSSGWVAHQFALVERKIKNVRLQVDAGVTLASVRVVATGQFSAAYMSEPDTLRSIDLDYDTGTLASPATSDTVELDLLDGGVWVDFTLAPGAAEYSVFAVEFGVSSGTGDYELVVEYEGVL